MLYKGSKNILSMCFLSLDQILILDLISLAWLFFKVSYHKEVYPFNLRMANLKALVPLYSVSSMILSMACTQSA